MALDYKGPSPSEGSDDENVGLIIMDTNNCQRLMDDFEVNRSKTLTLLQGGWADPGGFAGSNNYLNQTRLQSLLTGTSNNPCVQRPTVISQASNYVANSQVGQPNGVAGLDENRKIPMAQLPSMGGGYLIGPFGCNSLVQQASAGSLSSGPKKFAEWAIQSSGGVNFQPLVFMQVNATTSLNFGRTIIEVRMSNGPSTTYSYANPLVAMGAGRSFYTGIQTVSVFPCGSANGLANTSYSPSYNIYLTAWVYDSGSGTSTINGTDVVVATAFLMRV